MQEYRSLEDFIIERCKEIGVYEVLPQIDYNTVLDHACAGFEEKHIVHAQKTFWKIYNGEKSSLYDIPQRNFNPFVALMQKLMHTDGLCKYVRKGYFDIETKLAVEKTNKKLRHDETWHFCTIDNHFLEEIVETYAVFYNVGIMGQGGKI